LTSAAALDTHAIAFGALETHSDEGMLPRPRQVTDGDWIRFERYAAEMLTSFGMDLSAPGTGDTPRRFVRALFDATDGYDLAQVVEGPIPFFALCEHHVLPFFGRAYVGYVAHDQIIGISKLTRLVRVVTRRFGVQERMTHDIADGLTSMLRPHGVAVYLEAHHLCTQMRGVREHDPMTRTTAYRGTYVEQAALRQEFRDISGIGRSR
jgi:GTP cyclohydrolase I